MRDLALLSIVLPAALVALRRPWVGVMLWTWLSLMNPHRYTWGFAATAPLAALAAVTTLIGLLVTRERESPFKGAPPVWLALFTAWMTVSWLMGLDVSGDHAQWDKITKINLMVLVTLALLRTKQHIIAFAWVCALSLGLLGAKGGLFTILNGGAHTVWGPPGSFIADNNHLALALVMTIPLLRFLQMQLQALWARQVMTVWMVLVAASALGSHSRGALLAIAAMTVLLWWRGGNKFAAGLLIAAVAYGLVTFMPDEWTGRMETIGAYEEDQSAQGRLAAWSMAWNAAFHYPFGVGFDAAREDLFAKYAANSKVGTPVAHSIYFQVLGQHGFVGLALFLLLGISTWRWAARMRKEAAGFPQASWCADLAGMCQVSLLGYAVGGAFLNMAHFDLPYNIMALVVMARVWMLRRGWETEPTPKAKGWLRIPGLGTPEPAAKER